MVINNYSDYLHIPITIKIAVIFFINNLNKSLDEIECDTTRIDRILRKAEYNSVLYFFIKI